MTAAIMVAALALDSLTFLMIGDLEANPLVNVLGPGLALGIRWAAIVSLLVLARFMARPRPYLLLVAAFGVIGAASNTRTLWIYGGFAGL